MTELLWSVLAGLMVGWPGGMFVNGGFGLLGIVSSASLEPRDASESLRSPRVDFSGQYLFQ
jgi:hypothetical protein